MPVTRWTLFNPQTGQTVTFPRNPIQGFVPPREKQIDAQTSTNPNGQPLLFEGPQKVRESEFTGNIKDEAHYRFMVAWFDSPAICTVTNHLGQTMLLYLTQFEMKPKNRHNNPWAGDYTASAIWMGGTL